MKKDKFKWVKNWYINGSLKIGNTNLYGLWNNKVYKLYRFLSKNFNKHVNTGK